MMGYPSCNERYIANGLFNTLTDVNNPGAGDMRWKEIEQRETFIRQESQFLYQTLLILDHNQCTSEA